ncbi:MAG TPA: hypothetical protein VGM06_12445 [Polyangiaceae bacterium]
MRERILVLAAAVAAALASAQCETHQCDSSTVVYGGADAGQPPGSSLQMTAGGQMIWQSSPNEGPWLDFLGDRTFVFTFPQPFACELPVPSVELSADVNNPVPSAIVGVAGLAPYSRLVTDDAGLYRGITITSSTCGEYGLNVIVTGTPAGVPCNVQVFDGGPYDPGPQASVDDASAE